MSWAEKVTRSRIAKCLWWAITVLALFFGVLGVVSTCIAARVGVFESGAEEYWQTSLFSYYVDIDSAEIINRAAQLGWQETDAQHMGMQDHRFLQYHIYQINEDGQQVEEIYRDDIGETRRVLRRYVDAFKNGSYSVTSEEVYNQNGLQPSVVLFGGEQKNSMHIVVESYIDEDKLFEPQNSANMPQTWVEEQIQMHAQNYVRLRPVKNQMVAAVVICAIAGLIALVMIGLGTGRTVGSNEAKLCGYDRIPMELQGAVLLLAAYTTLYFAVRFLYVDTVLLLLRSKVVLFAVCSVVTGIVLYGLIVFYSFVRWAKIGRPLSCFWAIRILGKVWRWGIQKAKIIFSAIPMVWQGLLLCMVVAGLHLLNILFPYGVSPVVQLALWILLWGVMVFGISYAAIGVRSVQRQVNSFLAGDYQAQPEFESKLPDISKISQGLCRIGDGMNTAVEQRIKSERMKTELITNVSHDLKTPLTSIINYTDLLAKEDLPESAREYAGVIAQQGERLRKLTEDLVEASKAASGVLSCTKVPTDLTELCQQAAAEYADRIEAAGLTPVLTLPEDSFTANLDGRLTWRILDNLFSNACKYAQPGTRVYLVGEQDAGYVTLTMKNISRDPLNIPAEELMERFVRGDSARTGEGSGLGLSIARSLSELQGGQFSLYVNGDLFQAQVRFPKQ